MSDIAASFFSPARQRMLLIIAVVATYGVALANGFVWDDTILFIGNPVYREFNLRAIFLSLANDVEYLPLRDLTYALDYLFWGEHPFGFHLSNLVFFALNVLLVHQLSVLAGRRLAALSGRGVPPRFPLLVAAGFALHPINSEAVNFITCRNVLVSGVFVFLAAIWMFRYLEEHSRRWLFFALIAFLCALLGKATALMLPILFLLFFSLLFPEERKRIAVALIPFFVAATGFFLLFKQLAERAGFTGTDLVQFSIWRKSAQAVQIPFFYLHKLLLPYGFAVEYSTDFSPSLLSLRGGAAIAGLLLLAATAYRLRRSFPELAAGLLWFIAALIPVLNFFSTHPLVADRYAFLPAFGFMLFVAAAVERIPAVRVRSVAAATACVILGGLSVDRSFDWRSDITLFQDNIRKYPHNTEGYLSLALALFRQGDHQQALALLEQNRTVPWLNLHHGYLLGAHHYQAGEYAKAREAFLKPLEVASGYIGPLYYLGLLAEKEADYVAAAEYYNRALASRENDTFNKLPLVRQRLEVVKKGGLDGQIRELRQRVAANPADLSARRDLAMTLDRLGFYTDAVHEYLEIEKGGFKGWQIYQNLANCYFNLNNSDEVVRYYEKVLQLGGGTEETYTNLGIAYRKLGKFDRAIAMHEEGSRRFPESPYSLYNLGVTYHAADRKDAARSTFLLIERRFPDYKDKIAPYLK